MFVLKKTNFQSNNNMVWNKQTEEYINNLLDKAQQHQWIHTTSEKYFSKDSTSEIKRLLDLSFDILQTKQSEVTFASSFIFLFNIVEIIANEFIDEKNPISNPENKYSFKFKSNSLNIDSDKSSKYTIYNMPYTINKHLDYIQ